MFTTFKEFFKENSKVISKIWLNHFGSLVFGFVILMVTNKLGQIPYQLAGVIAILFYLILLYVTLWEKGAEDKVRIEGGRLSDNKSRGLLLCVVAYIPIFVFIAILFVCSIFVTPEEVTAGGNFYAIIKIILNYMNAMYLSVISVFNKLNIHPSIFPFVYMLITLPGLVVSMLSYISGVIGQRCFIPERKKQNK